MQNCGRPPVCTYFLQNIIVKMQYCADWVKLASFYVSSISFLLLAKILTELEFVKMQYWGVCNYFHQNKFCQNAALCRLSKASFILRLLNDQWLEGKNKLSTRNLTLNIKTMVMKSTQAKIQKYCLSESKLLFHRRNLSVCRLSSALNKLSETSCQPNQWYWNQPKPDYKSIVSINLN